MNMKKILIAVCSVLAAVTLVFGVLTVTNIIQDNNATANVQVSAGEPAPVSPVKVEGEIEYDAAAKKGVLLYYPEIIPGKGRKSAIWEVPYAYMKYYMITDIPDFVPENWESPVYTVILRGFETNSVENIPQIIQKEVDSAAKIKFSPVAKPE